MLNKYKMEKTLNPPQQITTKKLKKRESQWYLPMISIQSYKDNTKMNYKDVPLNLESWNVLLFLSHQIVLIRQSETTTQTTLLKWQRDLPFQPTNIYIHWDHPLHLE